MIHKGVTKQITKRNWSTWADLAYFERGIQLLKGGLRFFDGGDYVTEYICT